MKNFKTTSTGITMIVSGIVGAYFAYKNNQLNEATITACLTSILGGIGLMFAKDNNVTGGKIVNEPNYPSIVKESAKSDK